MQRRRRLREIARLRFWNGSTVLTVLGSCSLKKLLAFDDIVNKTLCGDLLVILPSGCCDLIFADPPYKELNGKKFKGTTSEQYAPWLRAWLPEMKRLLKPHGSIYVCGDWRSAAAIQTVLEEHFMIQNRITWEREKGRGAKTNWKNNSEDIWFARFQTIMFSMLIV